MTVAEFLDLLQSRALLPEETLANLRQQVSRSPKNVTPESLTKLLVGKGLLTAFQAEQLLASAKPAPLDIDDDELGLAPLDDEKPLKSTPAAKPTAAKPTAAKSTATAAVATKTVSTAPAQRPASTPPKTAAAKPKPNASAKPSGSAAGAKPPPQAKLVGLPPAPGPLDDLFGMPPADDLLLGAPLAGGSTSGGLMSGGPLLGNPLLGDPLFGDALPAGSAGAPAIAATAGGRRPSGRRKKGAPKWVWFASSGAAALIGVAIAVVILTRSNGDPEWQLAEKDYQAGQDQDATQKLDAFLESFPQHRQASLARCYSGMTRLRQAFAAKTDFDGQLAAARDVLPKLVVEPAFPQVREAVAKLLPDMAAGLTQEAEAFHGPLAARHEKAEQAREGLTLAEDWRFVPDKLKPWAALEATSDQLARLSRAIDRGLAVEAAATAIHASIAAGKSADAIAIRDALLQTYPELRQDSEFDPVAQELTHDAPQLVKIDAQPRLAETKPRATPILAAFTDVAWQAASDHSAEKPGEKKPAADTPSSMPHADPKSASIAVLADGAVYWLQASNGAPLGRQFVGLQSVAPVATPAEEKGETAIGEAASAAANWVVFDAVHKELVCYGNGGTVLRWRQALGDALDAPPLLLNNRLYAATRGGRLAAIDADTGKWLSAVQFPEPLRAAPGVSADGKTLYVAGDHGTLYFVSAGDLQCTAAAWLGYGSGSVGLPPVALGQYVVLVENPDWDASQLRVVSLLAAGMPPRGVQKIALPGSVRGAPIVAGKQLRLATDEGVVIAFDASGSGAFPLIKSSLIKSSLIKTSLIKSSITKSAQSKPFDRNTSHTTALAESRHDAFLALTGNRLWLAGSGLAHCDLDASSGSPHFEFDTPSSIDCQEPPLIEGNRVFEVYRRTENEGVWITAISRDGKPAWRAVVAAPPVGELVFDADSDALRFACPWPATVVAFPASALKGDRMLAVPSRLGDGSADPDLARDLARNRDRIAALGRGNLLANPVGQMCWIDPNDFQPLAAAFQPRLIAGQRLQWRKPAIVPGKLEAILSDGAAHLYRIGIDEKPSPHLAALAEGTLTSAVASDIAVAGTLAFVADDADILTALNVADLKAAKSWPLGGRVAWGPRRVGDLVLVATDRELLAIDNRPDIAWRVPLDAGIPVGAPLASGENLLLATADGFVVRIDRKTGRSGDKIDLEQPLAAGPIACGKNLAVVGRDGSILVVARGS